jgi:AcrR family transcriptional regulator
MSNDFSSSESLSGLSRRERERRMRRQAMLRAARVVFAEKGYARATLDEIAERAEFGKGTLYNYFEGGKEEILYAIFDQTYDEITELLESVFDPERLETNTLREMYHDLVVQGFQFYGEREEVLIILLKEAYRMAFSDDQDRAAYFHDQRERLVSTLLPAIERAAANDAMHALPPRAVAHMLLENLNGMLVHRSLARMSDADLSACTGPAMLDAPESAADFLTTMLFDGLSPTPGGSNGSAWTDGDPSDDASASAS